MAWADAGVASTMLREPVDATTCALTTLQLGGGAARCRDLLLGRSAERVSLQLELHATELAGAEDLHRLALADRTGVDELGRADLAAVGEELNETVQVDHLEHHLELVLEALELRQPHVDGHLPALERRRHLVAGLGALGAAAGRLALGALTAADTRLRGLGARSRTQVVDLDRH